MEKSILYKNYAVIVLRKCMSRIKTKEKEVACKWMRN